VRIERKSASGYDVLAEYTYNDAHQPLTRTGPAGQVTRYTYNPAGQISSVINALGHTTRYEYDALGYLATVIDPNGQTQVSYTYDDIGRVATATDTAGYTLTYSYDALDPDGTHEDVAWDRLDVSGRTDRYGNMTGYDYDALRNLVSETDPSGHLTRYGYFANGRRSSLTDGRGNVTQWQRDLQRRITRETRADGSETSYSYDSSGRRTGVTDALGGRTDYGYAHDNRLAAVTDPNGNTTTYGYDAYSGERIEQDSPDTGLTANAFDIAGNLLSRTDAKGQRTLYGYDVLDRLIRVEYADGQVIDYVYDSAPNGIGRLAGIHEASGVTAFEYDARGQMVKRTQTAPEDSVLVTGYAYTDAGLPERIIYPSGAVVEYSYANDRLAGIRVNGRPVFDGIEYTAFGPLAGWSRANGLTDSRLYDAAGALEQFSVAAELRQLAYDPVGNVIGIEDDSGLLVPMTPTATAPPKPTAVWCVPTALTPTTIA